MLESVNFRIFAAMTQLSPRRIARGALLLTLLLLTAGATPNERVILILGDSISAGYGLDLSQAYPALLQQQIDSRGWRFKVVNAGQSGDTSAGGLNRMDWLLRNRVDVLVLELGANDGLDGVDIGTLERLSVTAAAPGTVEATGELEGYSGYGNVILIDHGEGRETLYAHLSHIRATVGEHVEAGTWIGTAGCTGSCTGTHLHFELRKHGIPVDPTPLMDAQ